MAILTSFFGMIGGFITSLVAWLVKRFGYSAVLFTLHKSAQVLIITALMAFAYWFTGFIINLWTMISDFVNSFQNINVGAGDAFGITLAVIIDNVKGFIYASGLSTAIVTTPIIKCMRLSHGIFSGYLIISFIFLFNILFLL